MDDQMLRAECPHCSFRFADPEEPLHEGAELGCPECRGIFYVLSLHPPVFDVVDARDGRASLFMHDLIVERMSEAGSRPESVALVVERARKQGLRGITFRVSFEEPSRDLVTIPILSLD